MNSNTDVTADAGYEQAHVEMLRKQVARFPRRAGVYLMKDEGGQIIYIGKAKALRDRVRTYFAGGDGRQQIEFLMRRVRQIDTVVTESEEQAFILERDLINKYKPRYNIRLKDDKAYLSIRVDENSEWPRLELVRKVERDGARYYGPYSFSYEVRSLLEMIKRVVPLRTCTDTVFYNRQRPCLEYQIKRCAGPCCLPVDREQYRGWVAQAVAILEGKTSALKKELDALMERASKELRFEDAAVLRDRLAVLQSFKEGQKFTSSRGEDRDVFALFRDESVAALSVLAVRHGRVSDNVNFLLSDVRVPHEEILESAIGQYYQGGREIPEEIVVDCEMANVSMLEQTLSRQRTGKVEIVFAQRGVRARLLNLAGLNAQQYLASKLDSEARYSEIAKDLAKMFNLRQLPRRIECVDISHFHGTDNVGATVSFFDGAADKSAYRRYKISEEFSGDDFGSIFEVLSRRFYRGLKEGDLPDLLVVDGGEGQLNAALSARERLKVSLDIIALAKMRSKGPGGDAGKPGLPERIFLPGRSAPIPLDSDAQVTHFLQRVRDEVHRYVVSFHRSRRAKRVVMSALDRIPGVGPDRKRRLLSAYGSVEKISSLPADEIARTGRMPLSLARRLKKELQ